MPPRSKERYAVIEYNAWADTLLIATNILPREDAEELCLSLSQEWLYEEWCRYCFFNQGGELSAVYENKLANSPFELREICG